MIISYSPKSPLIDVESSNIWLRRLWAKLRENLGIGMQFTPRRDGPQNSVFIGFISLGRYSTSLLEQGIRSTVQISYSYKSSGIIDAFIFDIPDNWSSACSLDEVAFELKKACSDAEKDRPLSSTYKVLLNTPMQVQFPDLSGPQFVFSSEQSQSYLTLTVDGYGAIDSEHQFGTLATDICILASAWSGHLWFADSADRTNRLVDYTSIISLCSDDGNLADIELLKDAHFSTIVGLLVTNRKKVAPLLKAAHLMQRSIYTASCDSGLLGDAANTLAMSALEVLSEKGVDPQNCQDCGQPQYKISKRVREYAAKMLDEKSLERWFNNRYANRSKFLHTGAIQHKGTHAGHSVPLIDLGATEGFALPMQFSFDHVLSCFVREIFRGEADAIAA